MEIFDFYQTAVTLLLQYGEQGTKVSLKETLLISAIVALSLAALLFIFQGIGLYCMAKKQGLKNGWLAFLPFGNIYYMGKMAGTCQFFGQKLKRTGLYVMLAQIFTTLVAALYIAAQFYLVWNCGDEVKFTEWQSMYWIGLTGFANVANAFYEVSTYVLSMLTLVTKILLTIMLIALFKKYSPFTYRMLALVCFFIPAVRFICIFVLRNRKPFDFEAFIRRQQEEFIRRQQEYYNTYGRPNGSYGPHMGSPYGMGGYQGTPQPPRQPEEPFGEFNSNNKPTPDQEPSSQEEESSNGDDFFD